MFPDLELDTSKHRESNGINHYYLNYPRSLLTGFPLRLHFSILVPSRSSLLAIYSGQSLAEMAFLFNRGRRQPLEVVRSIKDLLEKLRETPNTPKVCETRHSRSWLS